MTVKEQETTGARQITRITAALSSAGKRAALASQIGITDGQLSKMLNGELRRLCALLDLLGLEVVPGKYISSIEEVLREKLRGQDE